VQDSFTKTVDLIFGDKEDGCYIKLALYTLYRRYIDAIDTLYIRFIHALYTL